MAAEDGPLLIAYDGSDAARAAVRAAAGLFGGSRQVLLVTVWEPGLALQASMPTPDVEMSSLSIDMQRAQELEDEMQKRASRTAQEGADLAQSLGLRAEGLAVAEEVPAADAIVGLAGEREVAAIVVGSRGLRGLRARLEGSTSNAVVKTAPCPVIVVHDD